MTFTPPSAQRYRRQDDAACAEIGPALFLTEQGDRSVQARRICKNTCPVRQACLDAAMEEEAGKSLGRRTGIRGGLGPLDRYRLDRKARRTK